MNTDIQGTNLLTAANEWRNRPADQRYWTLDDLRAACDARQRASVELAPVPTETLTIQAAYSGADSPLLLDGSPLTAYSAQALCTKVSAPYSYVRTLPPAIAAECLSHGIRRTPGQSVVLRSDVVRAITSDRYERVWDAEIVDLALELQSDGYRVPPARPAHVDARTRPATEADVLTIGAGGGAKVKVGDPIAPAGLYASDRDVFMFLVKSGTTIDDGTDTGLSDGVILWNSEVGDKSLGMQRFSFKGVCGNHIVWGLESMAEIRMRHTGTVRDGLRMMSVSARHYETGQGERECLLRRAAQHELGASKKDVVDALRKFFGARKATGMGVELLGDAFDAAEQHRDWYRVPPTTALGMLHGITEVSQRASNTDARMVIDRQAGALLTMGVA